MMTTPGRTGAREGSSRLAGPSRGAVRDLGYRAVVTLADREKVWHLTAAGNVQWPRAATAQDPRKPGHRGGQWLLPKPRPVADVSVYARPVVILVMVRCLVCPTSDCRHTSPESFRRLAERESGGSTARANWPRVPKKGADGFGLRRRVLQRDHDSRRNLYQEVADDFQAIATA